MRHLPNALTVGRIVAAPICLYLLYVGGFWATFAGTVLFILAAITDYWDGRLARDLGVSSRFGQFLDPLADKILVLGAFFVLPLLTLQEPGGADAFQLLKWMPWWAVGLIAVRDVAVTALRSYEQSQGRNLKTLKAAKWKTAWQLTFLITVEVFLVFALAHRVISGVEPFSRLIYRVLDSPFTLVFLLLTLAATLYTGALYFLKRETD